MFISGLSQSYLMLYGVLTLIMVVAFTLFNVINEADMRWDIDEDDYFNIARGAGIMGLFTSALYLAALVLNGLSTLENTGIVFNWDLAWVAPATTIVGTLLAPVLSLVLTKIFKITFSTTGALTKTIKTALYGWCSLLNHIGTPKK